MEPCLCGDPYCRACFPVEPSKPVAVYLWHPVGEGWFWCDPVTLTPLEDEDLLCDALEVDHEAIQGELADMLADDRQPEEIAVFWDGDVLWAGERPEEDE